MLLGLTGILSNVMCCTLVVACFYIVFCIQFQIFFHSCLSNAQTRESYDWKLDHDDSDWSSDDGFCHCGDDDIFMDLGDLLFFFSMFGDSGSRSRRRRSGGFRRRR